MGRLSGHRAVPFGPHFHCVSKIVNTYTYKTASSMQGRGEGRRSITASNLVVRKLPMQRTERQMVSSSHNPFIAVVACTDHPSLPPSSTSSLIMKHRCCSSVRLRLSDLVCSQNPSAKVCSCVGDYFISMDSLNLISLGFLDLPFPPLFFLRNLLSG